MTGIDSKEWLNKKYRLMKKSAAKTSEATIHTKEKLTIFLLSPFFPGIFCNTLHAE